MSANDVRLAMDDVDAEERQEIEAILALAKTALPARGYRAQGEAPPDAPRVSARGPAVRKGAALVTRLLPDATAGKRKAGTRQAKAQELRSRDVERETGFEPATLSLGS